MLVRDKAGLSTLTPWADRLTEVGTGQKGIAFVQNHLGLVMAEKCLLHSSKGWLLKTPSYHNLSSASILVHSMKPMQAL